LQPGKISVDFGAPLYRESPGLGHKAQFQPLDSVQYWRALHAAMLTETAGNSPPYACF